MARIATRIAKNDIQARSLAMLMYLQNGLPIIYYGEELGMKNLEFEDVTQFEYETVKEFIESAKKAGNPRTAKIKLKRRDVINAWKSKQWGSGKTRRRF